MFQTNRITLIGDRRGGERFPQIRGAFLLIDKCDIPCEISLDGSFYFMAREGLDIRGPFNELYIRHPVYMAGTEYNNISDAHPSINIITSVDSAINNYYSDSYFPAGLPFQFTGSQVVCPIFGNIRYVKLNFEFWMSVNSQPADFRTATITNPSLVVQFNSSIEQASHNVSNGGFDLPDPDATGPFSNFTHGGSQGNKFIILGKYSQLAAGFGISPGGALVTIKFESFDIPVQSNSKFMYATLNTPEITRGTVESFSDGRSIGTILAK